MPEPAFLDIEFLTLMVDACFAIAIQPTAATAASSSITNTNGLSHLPRPITCLVRRRFSNIIQGHRSLRDLKQDAVDQVAALGL
jgi:hypothetical protein